MKKDQINSLDLNVFSPKRLSKGAWHGHTIFAQWLVSILKPKMIVELGTHNGDSYFSFCQSVKKNKLSTKCFAVDTWKGEEHAGYYSEEVYKDVLHHNNENYSSFSTLIRKFFDDAVDDFKDNSIDLLHIDGLHTYEAVMNDFNTWKPKLTKNAIVLFHDISEVKEDFGVYKLWEELTEKYKNSFSFLHSHGLGVLGVGNSYPSDIKKMFSANWLQTKKYRQLFSDLSLLLNEPSERKRLSMQDKLINLYIDTGKGFSENEKLSTNLKSLNDEVVFFLNDFTNLQKIRIDVGRNPCLVQISDIEITFEDNTSSILKISTGNYKKLLQLPSPDNQNIPDGYVLLFNKKNPRILIEPKTESCLSISFKYRILGFDEITNYSYIGELESSLEEKKTSYNQLSSQMIELNNSNENLKEQNKNLNVKIDKLDNLNSTHERVISELNEHIDSQDKINNELENNFKLLKDELNENKDFSKNQEHLIRSKDSELTKIKVKIEEKEKEISNFYKKIDQYSNDILQAEKSIIKNEQIVLTQDNLLTKLKLDLEDRENTILSNKVTINEYKDNLLNAEIQISDNKHSIQIKETEIAKLNVKLKESEKKIYDYISTIDTYDKDLISAEKINIRNDQIISSQKSEISRLKEEILNNENLISILNSNINAFKDDLKKSERAVDIKNNELDNKSILIKQLSQKTENIENILRNYDIKLSNTELELKIKQTNAEKLAQENLNLMQKNTALQITNSECNTIINNLHDEVKSLQNEIRRLDIKYKDLNGALNVNINDINTSVKSNYSMLKNLIKSRQFELLNKNKQSKLKIKEFTKFILHPKFTITTNKNMKILRKSLLFDDDFYLENNTDLYLSSNDLLKHFLTKGYKEGRDPSAYFSIKYYLDTYKDVKAANVNPVLHYLKYGAKEGRNPSSKFCTISYKKEHNLTDGINPLTHYLLDKYQNT